MISLWCALLLDSILPTVELLSKLESILSNPRAALSTNFLYYFKTFVIISTIFIASSPGISFHLKKLLSLLIHMKQLLICSSLTWDCITLVIPSGSTSISLAILPRMHGCYPWRLKPTSFQFLSMLVFWPLPQITNVNT